MLSNKALTRLEIMVREEGNEDVLVAFIEKNLLLASSRARNPRTKKALRAAYELTVALG